MVAALAPYAAGVLAMLIFSPVLIWNSSHHWASFAFQGERAEGLRFHPLAPLTTLLGEALFVLPWFALPMLVLGWKALRSDGREQLLAWLAAPPIVVFALISMWSSQRVLYHWAAPGYLMLFPLFGRLRGDRVGPAGGARDDRRFRRVVRRRHDRDRHAEFSSIGCAVMPAKDPTAEGLDWTSLRDDLAARGLLRLGTVVGVPNWRDAGKIAHALGPDVPVICLNRDARQFGFANPAARWAGANVLLLVVDHPIRVLPALRGRSPRSKRCRPPR